MKGTRKYEGAGFEPCATDCTLGCITGSKHIKAGPFQALLSFISTAHLDSSKS